MSTYRLLARGHRPWARALVSAVLFWLAAWAGAFADDWPAWRGPRRDGISAETGWKDQWGPDGPQVLWRAEVGTGFSSFAVAQGRAFTLGNQDEKDTVTCFEAETGRVLWTHAYPSDLGDHFFEGGPTATPTVSGEFVYTLGRGGELWCLDIQTGQARWSKNVRAETGCPAPAWGFGGSPLAWEDLLILNVGEAGLAVDRGTGRVVWKSAAKEPGYSTPLPLGSGSQTLVILGSGRSYLAVHPRTGQEAWRVRWITQNGANAADPVLDSERIFISTGYGKGAALFRLGTGEPEPVWQGKAMRTQMNSCILLGGHLYGVDGDTTEKSTLKCIALLTGAEKWSRGSLESGSLTAADGKLIVLGGSGELEIGKASPEGFTPTGRARILDGKCWTVPVLSGGRLYARNAAGRVVCLNLRNP
jgi:outer membrane protein assembly factor BamB